MAKNNIVTQLQYNYSCLALGVFCQVFINLIVSVLLLLLT